jgi:putative resolvase
MKLSAYARKLGIHYNTAYNYWVAGKLDAYQTHTGTIIVKDDAIMHSFREKTVIYARVSSSENRPNLDAQAARLVEFCGARGWVVDAVVKEVGSGVNDARPKWLRLLSDPSITRIVVEHKDRFTRFGFTAYQALMHTQQREIFVVNNAADDRADLMQDFVSIITSFCARIYGQRRSRRHTERLIHDLQASDAADPDTANVN